jgi:hypothetical protein
MPLKCKFNHHLYTHYLSGTTPHQNWTHHKKKEVYGQCVSEPYQTLEQCIIIQYESLNAQHKHMYAKHALAHALPSQ